MNEENIKKRSSKKIFIFIACFIIFIIALQFHFFLPRLTINRHPAKDMVCRNNLKQFGLVFQMYTTDNSNSYPIPDKWCDLVIPYLPGGDNKIFQCRPAEKARCHYAMNPNCEPNSPPDTVLLFETKGGWNLSGGQKLLTTENHTSNTCNVLFNDGSVGTIRKEEIPNLKWNAEK